MPFQESEFTPDLENYPVFPHEIRINQHILYHGTASYHEQSFENNGALYYYRPFKEEEIRNLLHIMTELNLDVDGTLYDLLQKYLTRIKPFSLTPLSLHGVFYASTPGRLVLNKIKDAFTLIDIIIQNNSNVRDETMAKYTAISSLKESLQNYLPQGIVLDFEFRDTDIPNLPFHNYTIQPNRHIPVERIIGKVVVPGNFNLPDNCDNIAMGKSFGLCMKEGTFMKKLSLYYINN